MSTEWSAIVDDLERGLDREETGPVLEAAQRLRHALAAEIEERTLEAEDPLLAKRRRLHQRLEVLEAKVRARRFEDADEDLDAVREIAAELEAGLEAREAVDDEAERAASPAASGLRWVARREAKAIATAPAGPVLAAVSLLVFTLALQAAHVADADSLEAVWRNASTPALVLAPLSGLAVGVDRLGGDLRAGRLPMLTTAGLTRARLVLAKALGTAAALALVIVGPALLVGLVGLGLGLAPSLAASGAALLGLGLAGTSFAAIAIALEAHRARWPVTLAGTVAAYLLLGPIWASAVQAGDASSAGTTLALLLERASPVAAAEQLFAADGFTVTAAAGLAVLTVWTLAGVAVAAFLADRDGFPAARTST